MVIEPRDAVGALRVVRRQLAHSHHRLREHPRYHLVHVAHFYLDELALSSRAAEGIEVFPPKSISWVHDRFTKVNSFF